MSERPRRSPCSPDVLLPQRGLEGFARTLELARAHEARLARDYRIVYALNLLTVSGALSSRLSGLSAGLLSNAGTALIYAQHALALIDWLSLRRRSGRGRHSAGSGLRRQLR